MSKHKYIPVDGFQRNEIVVVAEIQNKSVTTKELSVKAELEEQPVIVFSNTVVYPWTVVIHLSDTVPTSTAVVRAFWSHHVAFVA